MGSHGIRSDFSDVALVGSFASSVPPGEPPLRALRALLVSQIPRCRSRSRREVAALELDLDEIVAIIQEADQDWMRA